jgi:hypothetical protein
MNLPTPGIPTDNLYKFIAISGLVVFVAGFLVPLQLQNNIDLEATKLSSAIRNATGVKVDVNHPAENTMIVKKPLPTLSGSSYPTTTEAIEDTAANIQELMDLYITHRQITARTILVANIFGAIGFVLMFVGFKLWYQRVQKFQDQIIKAEAQETKSKSK